MTTDALQGLRTHFRVKGRLAFHAGRARDSHGLNHGADAIADFFIGYDAAAQNSPTSHTAPALRRCIDLAHTSAGHSQTRGS